MISFRESRIKTKQPMPVVIGVWMQWKKKVRWYYSSTSVGGNKRKLWCVWVCVCKWWTVVLTWSDRSFLFLFLLSPSTFAWPLNMKNAFYRCIISVSLVSHLACTRFFVVVVVIIFKYIWIYVILMGNYLFQSAFVSCWSKNKMERWSHSLFKP